MNKTLAIVGVAGLVLLVAAARLLAPVAPVIWVAEPNPGMTGPLAANIRLVAATRIPVGVVTEVANLQSAPGGIIEALAPWSAVSDC